MTVAQWRSGERGFWSTALVYFGVLASVVRTDGLGDEIVVDQLSTLGDKDVRVSFAAEFPDARFETLPGGRNSVQSFVRVFKDELETAAAITSSESIEVPVAKSPPLTLEGRAVFRGAESPFPHTKEANDFIKKLTDKGVVGIQTALANALQNRGYPELGLVVLSIRERPVINQDVTVVVPGEATKASDEHSSGFFDENPEVLAALLALVGLLVGILATGWWYIYREHCRRKAMQGKLLSVKVQHGKQTAKKLKGKDKPSIATGQAGNNLPSEKRLEFDRLEFIERIGTGSFKTVYRGRWCSNNVAIARMRKGGVLVEARLMEKLSVNPNLVTYYKWTIDSDGNEYIVMELVEMGSLDKVLHQHLGKVGIKAKVAMCVQICQAMCQLAKEKVLHRDLAARNVLVQSLDPPCVKVSDFGLSKYVSPGLPPLSSSAVNHLPVRWIPPEVMEKHEWSEKSDVWAFGVTMWEIFSDAREPYAERGLSDNEVVQAVLRGEHLPQPKSCPDGVYDMMRECWHAKPSDRPNFIELSRRFHVNVRELSKIRRSGRDSPRGMDRIPRTDESSSKCPVSEPGNANTSEDCSSSQHNSTSRAPHCSASGGSLRIQPISWNSGGSEEFIATLEKASLTGSTMDNSKAGSFSPWAKHGQRFPERCESISSIPDPEYHEDIDYRSSFQEMSPKPLSVASAASVGSQSPSLHVWEVARIPRTLASVPEHQKCDVAQDCVDTKALLKEEDVEGALLTLSSDLPSAGPYRRIKEVVDGGAR